MIRIGGASLPYINALGMDKPATLSHRPCAGLIYRQSHMRSKYEIAKIVPTPAIRYTTTATKISARRPKS